MTDWFHLHLFWTKFTPDVLCKSYMCILKTKFIHLKERSISFVLVLLSNWPILMSGLSFWYFFVSFLFLLFFFLKKENIVLMFSLFWCCCVASFMKWSINYFLLSVASSTSSVYEFIWQLDGYFYSLMSLIFFNVRYFYRNFTILSFFNEVLQYS